MRSLIISLLISIFLGFLPESKSQPTGPQIWPRAYFSSYSSNKTDIFGNTGQYFSSLKWYDYDFGRSAKTIQVFDDGEVRVALIRDVIWYSYNPGRRTCQRVNLGVGIVRPDWMLGARFIRRDFLNGIPLFMFDKEDHLLFESVPETRNGPVEPKVLFTPADNFLRRTENQYSKFISNPVIPRETFDIPSYCQSTSDITLEELLSHGDPDDHLWAAQPTPWGML